MTRSSATTKPILVAVDGSRESTAALRWAVDYAERANCDVRVITTYREPQTPSYSAGGYWESWIESEKTARERAEAAMVDVLGHAEIDHLVMLGPIERALEEFSDEASMIVVGTRATDTWLSRFRASVTNRITGAVDCPVVSIRSGEPSEDLLRTGS